MAKTKKGDLGMQSVKYGLDNKPEITETKKEVNSKANDKKEV